MLTLIGLDVDLSNRWPHPLLQNFEHILSSWETTNIYSRQWYKCFLVPCSLLNIFPHTSELHGLMSVCFIALWFLNTSSRLVWKSTGSPCRCSWRSFSWRMNVLGFSGPLKLATLLGKISLTEICGHDLQKVGTLLQHGHHWNSDSRWMDVFRLCVAIIILVLLNITFRPQYSCLVHGVMV